MKDLEKLNEKELFVFIEDVSGIVMKERIEQAVDLLPNFGIQPKDGDNISDDYWKWYEKQQDWFRELSEQEKSEYREAILNGT